MEALNDIQRKALERGISLHGGPSEETEGGFVYRKLRETVKEGSGNGAFLSMGALHGEPGWGEGSFKGSGIGRLSP